MMPTIGTNKVLILIKGAGDLASGVAWRLFRAGFPLVMTELPEPLMVRRTVSFGEAVFEGAVTVEGVCARRVAHVAAARAALAAGEIPVLIDPEAACREEIQPAVLVDAIMAKRNTGTTIGDAPMVLALGPGFTAGVDCHAVIETNRGHWLGRVLWEGAAAPDTGIPGTVMGKDVERVLRAPATGRLETSVKIGDMVQTGQVLAMVEGQPVRAGLSGVVRGMVRTGVAVQAGVKVGDVDPRGDLDHCFTVSDKALAIAGGVMEAVLGRYAGRGERGC